MKEDISGYSPRFWVVIYKMYKNEEIKNKGNKRDRLFGKGVDGGKKLVDLKTNKKFWIVSTGDTLRDII